MKDFLKFFQKNLQRIKIFLLQYEEHLPLGILLCILLIVISVEGIFSSLSLVLLPKPAPFSLQKPVYPVLVRQFVPDITAEAAIVLDTTSKVVLFSKNESFRFSPASTTKIMTALTALDYYHLDDVLTVQRSYVEGSSMGLTLGEQLSFQSLLYGMMLPSGNDAAFTIADNYPGGINEFVGKMNEKATLLHLDNTHYADPAGLIDEEDYTTPHDLSILASFAITHPVLSKVVDTSEIVVSDSAGRQFDLKNLNILLGLYGVNGLKTGYTDEAGQVLVTSAVIDNHTVIFVVMKSDDRFGDTEKLLQFVTNNISYLPIHP